MIRWITQTAMQIAMQEPLRNPITCIGYALNDVEPYAKMKEIWPCMIRISHLISENKQIFPFLQPTMRLTKKTLAGGSSRRHTFWGLQKHTRFRHWVCLYHLLPFDYQPVSIQHRPADQPPGVQQRAFLTPNKGMQTCGTVLALAHILYTR